MRRKPLSLKKLYLYEIDFIYDDDNQKKYTTKELEHIHKIITEYIDFIWKNPENKKY